MNGPLLFYQKQYIEIQNGKFKIRETTYLHNLYTSQKLTNPFLLWIIQGLFLKFM